MGESRASKETRKRLEERDRKAEEDRVRLLAAAEKDSPLQTAVEDSRLKDIRYFSQDLPDYSRPPAGMLDTTAFQRAALERLRSRAGIGGAGMEMSGANPNLLALSREHQDARTAEEGAGAYVGNLAQRRDEAFSGSDAIINRSVQRALALSGQASQTADSASQRSSSYVGTPSMWARLALAGVQGAAGVASSYFTGGYARAAK